MIHARVTVVIMCCHANRVTTPGPDMNVVPCFLLSSRAMHSVDTVHYHQNQITTIKDEIMQTT